MTNLTLKVFRQLTADLPEDTPIFYHAYYKGCCLYAYAEEDLWLYPKGGRSVLGVVMNPGPDYDDRRPGQQPTKS